MADIFKLIDENDAEKVHQVLLKLLEEFGDAGKIKIELQSEQFQGIDQMKFYLTVTVHKVVQLKHNGSILSSLHIPFCGIIQVLCKNAEIFCKLFVKSVQADLEMCIRNI
jgi:hypothetical protein